MNRRRRKSQAPSFFAFQDIITSVTGIIILLTLILTLGLVDREPRSPALQTQQMSTDVKKALRETREEIVRLRDQLDAGGDALVRIAGISTGELAREAREYAQQNARLEDELELLQTRSEARRRDSDRWQHRFVERKADRERLSRLNRETEELNCEAEEIRQSDRVYYRFRQDAGRRPWLLDVSNRQILVSRLGGGARPIAFDGSDENQRINSLLLWSDYRDPAAEYFVLLLRPSGIEQFAPLAEGLRGRGFQIGMDLIGEDQEIVLSEWGGAMP